MKRFATTLLSIVSITVAIIGCDKDVAIPAAKLIGGPDCFKLAGEYHGVDANVLRAIAMSNDPAGQATISREKNGTVSIGSMGINQVNFRELSKYDIGPKDILDNCKNVYVGAWYLKKKIVQHGNNWHAVGAYRSETPHIRDAYARQIYGVWRQLTSAQTT